jgi:pectate lyase
MKHFQSHRIALVAVARVVGLATLAACSSSDSDSSLFPPDGTAGGSGGAPPVAAAGSAGTPSNAAGTGGSVGQGGSGTPVGNEGNVEPVGGLAGAGGTGDGGNSGGAGGAGGAVANAGTGGNAAGAGGSSDVPVDCDVIPPPSALVGWAAVAGGGLDTTTGGGDLEPTLVTTLEELQDAVQGDDPRAILVRGQLEPGDIEIGSNKTLVGTCGAEIHGHVEIREVQNIIIRNLTIVGYGEGDCALDPDFDAAEGCSSGADAISVQRNAHHVWFDHDSVRDGTDGNLDVSNGANFVTISFTKFSYTPRTDDVGSDSTGASGHRYSNLVGGTDEPDDFDDANALNVTWHHNWWADNVVERQPRIRFGQNHLFNNYYNSLTSNYCVRAGIDANILLEGNFFDGVDDPHEFNNEDDQLTANITADASNIYDATTSDRATGGGGTPFTDPPYEYTLDDAAGIPALVQEQAGPR